MKSDAGALAVAVATLLAGGTTWAAEGGSSVYLQGTYNDFAVAIAGPPGFYLRNDVFYYDASVGPHPRGGQVVASVDQAVWANLLKLAYVSDIKIFGGTYGAAVALPYVLDADVSGNVAISGGPGFSRSGSVSGVGDMFVLPFQLFWTEGDYHFGFVPGIIVPTGRYDKDRLLNTGRNYGSFDLAGSYTWLDPKRGHELSLTTGVLFNAKNQDTDYRTGNEFHLDWTLAQHFSESFAIGLTGYWYKQITGDSGTLPAGFDASNFRASGVGVGAAALYSTKVGGTNLNFIGKWIADVDDSNRFKGNLFMLSIALKL